MKPRSAVAQVALMRSSNPNSTFMHLGGWAVVGAARAMPTPEEEEDGGGGARRGVGGEAEAEAEATGPPPPLAAFAPPPPRCKVAGADSSLRRTCDISFLAGGTVP